MKETNLVNFSFVLLGHVTQLDFEDHKFFLFPREIVQVLFVAFDVKVEVTG